RRTGRPTSHTRPSCARPTMRRRCGRKRWPTISALWAPMSRRWPSAPTAASSQAISAKRSACAEPPSRFPRAHSRPPMYIHDHYDRTLLQERVKEFSDQVKRRISGELSEDEFKSLRLMNGVYLQLHAYMLRVAIPYGTLSSPQLRMLAHVARKYDRGY